MAFTHTPGYTYKTDAGQLISVSKAYTGNEETDFDGVVAANAVNQQETLNITVANVIALMLYSDQQVTLKTNNSGAPQDTITLKAGIPIIWTSDSWDAKPFVGNVTNMFFTNSGATPANVKIRFLSNQ